MALIQRGGPFLRARHKDPNQNRLQEDQPYNSYRSSVISQQEPKLAARFLFSNTFSYMLYLHLRLLPWDTTPFVVSSCVPVLQYSKPSDNLQRYKHSFGRLETAFRPGDAKACPLSHTTYSTSRLYLTIKDNQLAILREKYGDDRRRPKHHRRRQRSLVALD
ncbi:uncharacterized protein PHALS_06473 [Plasmopara halstedii]|uniref:Uncharacterized protein n=1 Tax=Plasmopara halstedii TaxID=4781 RepID=A0A0P1B1U4_PLAHL|nr:uncharacterized protein PHALS_06473 [Plasmopara halstedii]CEG48662.1 hypothetical protein PHALS_06473 [Plasmopara halstedii]|eukprot:XP_024585031.1 hypothetical protein PHALS_06473 [Plasmopara halstedii]